MIPTIRLLLTSFFFFLELVISILCSLKHLQNFFIQSLPLYRSCSFFMLLNDGIVEIEKHYRICSPAFVVDEFSRLSVFPTKHSRYA